MTTYVTNTRSNEPTIFNFTGNKIKTEDREIDVLVKFEEPLVVVLGSVLDDEECDRLIELSRNRLQRSKIGVEKIVSDIRTSSGAFLSDVQDDLVSTVEKRIFYLNN